MAVAYGKTDQKYMGPIISTFTIDSVNYLLRLEYDGGKSPIVVRNDQGFEVRKICSGCNTVLLSAGALLQSGIVISVQYGQFTSTYRFNYQFLFYSSSLLLS